MYGCSHFLVPFLEIMSLFFCEESIIKAEYLNQLIWSCLVDKFLLMPRLYKIYEVGYIVFVYEYFPIFWGEKKDNELDNVLSCLSS